MSRSARLAAVTAMAALVAAAPSTASASARSTAKKAPAGAAAKSFAVLRAKARTSDDVLRAVGAKQRTLPRGAVARRVASGNGYAAYLLAGARVTVPGARVATGVHAFKGLQVVLVDGGDVSTAETSLAAAARDGVGVSRRLPDGSFRMVAVLPNGASKAVVTSGQRVRPRRIRRNAVVALTDATAVITFAAANGSVRTVGVTEDTPPSVALPATATLLEGSRVTLDLGNGVLRDVPLSGTVGARLPGGYKLASTNTFTFTGADLHVGATDLLTDSCATPALARLNPATGVTLDPQASSGSLAPDGTFSVQAAVGLRVVLDVRGEQGCGGPAAISGYADTSRLGFSLTGQLGKGGSLARFTLTSPPTPVTVNGCLAAGDPAKPCSQPTTAVNATAALSLILRLEIGDGPIPTA